MSTAFATIHAEPLTIPESTVAPAGGAMVLQPAVMVIFGATGDLTARKLMPALFALDQGGYLPPDLAIVGVGRRDKTDEQFRDDVGQALAKFRPETAVGSEVVQRFLGRIGYHRADFTEPDGLHGLREHVEAMETQRGLPGNRLFYVATDPEFFAPIVDALAAAKLVAEANGAPARGSGWRRVIIEKPFGRDLASAKARKRRDPQTAPRAPDLPHRPLPWEGNRAEPAGLPLRQRDL